MKKIVIIGFGVAGRSAAESARSADQAAEIVAITDEAGYAYSPCEIPFVLDSSIKKPEDIILLKPEFYRYERKINLLNNIKVVGIDANEKNVKLQDGEKIEYDSLIIATGGIPTVPPIKRRDLKGIFVVKTVEDCKKILEAMKRAKTAVIVGAGLIGLEVACAFNSQKIKTTVVEMLPQVLPKVLDPDMASEIQKEFTKKGISIILGKSVSEINGKEFVESVSVGNEKIDSDLVILATGTKPNVELGKNAGIEIGPTGAIKVDSNLKTNLPNIFAAGDCVESKCLVTGKPILSQLATTALKQGKVAGANAVGKNLTFPGVLNTLASVLSNIEVASTGVTEIAAKNAGLEIVVGKSLGKSRAFPGGFLVKTKLIFERKEKRIIGAQIIGERTAQRINVISIAIQKRADVFDLIESETAYAPSVSAVPDPVVLAAEDALKRF